MKTRIKHYINGRCGRMVSTTINDSNPRGPFTIDVFINGTEEEVKSVQEMFNGLWFGNKTTENIKVFQK
jgi:hypothetical protein